MLLSMCNPIRVFIGFDSKEPIAYHVLAHSILRRASVPMSVTPLVQDQLRKMGVYRRDRGLTESTEFSLTRFLVPYLCGYTGYAIFMDCDMLCLTDLAELHQLFAGDERTCPPEAVWVVKHDYVPKAETKFLGNVQTKYPRKNWSSVIIFNNERCRALTPDYVNKATGLELHRFLWTTDDRIGSLPLDMNYLVGESGQCDGPPRIIHYTNGGPWFQELPLGDHDKEWLEELDSMQVQLVPLNPWRSG